MNYSDFLHGLRLTRDIEAALTALRVQRVVTLFPVEAKMMQDESRGSLVMILTTDNAQKGRKDGTHPQVPRTQLRQS